MTYLAGGNQSTVMEDLHQASQIMRLLVFTDRIIKSSDFELKSVIRKQREDLICSLPKKRVWLFVKQMRTIGLQTQKPKTETEKFGGEGVEDTLIEGNLVPFRQRSMPTLTIKAQAIFKQAALCRLMYRAVDIEVFMFKRPNFGIVAPNISEVEIAQEMALVFDKSGIHTRS